MKSLALYYTLSTNMRPCYPSFQVLGLPALTLVTTNKYTLKIYVIIKSRCFNFKVYRNNTFPQIQQFRKKKFLNKVTINCLTF